MTTPPVNTALRNVWLTIRRSHGEVIRYRDGDLVIEGTEEKPLKAVPTTPDNIQVDGGGDIVSFASEELQFLIDPLELVDENGEQVEPRSGATIEIIRLEATYLLKPADGTDEVWRYSDPSRLWYRVHTQKTNHA